MVAALPTSHASYETQIWQRLCKVEHWRFADQWSVIIPMYIDHPFRLSPNEPQNLCRTQEMSRKNSAPIQKCKGLGWQWAHRNLSVIKEPENHQ